MSAAAASKRRCESPVPKPSGKETVKPAGGSSTGQAGQIGALAKVVHFCVAPLLSLEALEAIANHKYKAGAYTPLDNFLSPHLQTLTDCLPTWLAPNLITLGGAVPMTLATVYLGFRCPAFEDNAPPLLLCFWAVSLIFYLVCDAIDGKQARRTGSSSPLGQVFDHGIDCLMVISIHWWIFAVAGLEAKWAIPVQAGGQLLIFLGHWEEHFTHVFRASVGPVGVTEVTIFMSLMGLAGGLTDPKVLTALQRQPLGVMDLQLRHAVAMGWIAFVFVIMLCYLTVALKAAQKAKKLHRALMSLLPVLLLALGSAAWHPEALAPADPRLLSLVFGMLYFLHTAQMIVSSMAKQAYPAWQPTVPAFVALILLSWTLQHETFSSVLRLAAFLTIAFVLCWSVQGISQLATHLGIKVFAIKQSKKA
eukprot:TRINITY_DN54362_c0_g1_i1.p1 TRINITY_DN54362_c0_g1~~TRINITY_DN54362_c0_g1_i1.p1  ORF type:complete len:431 (-),score=74.95 TRINITY_DN54362_c0_g1_i1:34-1293(-)